VRLEIGVGRSVDEDSSSLEVEVSLAGYRIARQVVGGVEYQSTAKKRRMRFPFLCFFGSLHRYRYRNQC
jgi:hypothetical protein